jgi:hypothetical protein
MARRSSSSVPPSVADGSSSGPIPFVTRLLTRDFIHDALYAPRVGYFSRPSYSVVGTPPAPLRFSEMLGKSEYQHALKHAYDASAHSWMTPAEIFAPHYSHAVAAYLLAALAAQRGLAAPPHTSSSSSSSSSGKAASSPLVVYEIGGGNGTHARHVLDYIRHISPAVYRSMTYTVLEISAELAARQEDLLGRAHPGRAQVRVMDGTRAAESGLHDPRPCIVVGLEVLDNLPHDKVVALEGRAGGRDNKGAPQDDGSGHALFETTVVSTASNDGGGGGGEDDDGRRQQLRRRAKPSFREEYRPLADPLIVEAYAVWRRHRDSLPPSSSRRPLSPSPSPSSLLRSVLSPPLLPPPPPGFRSAVYLPTGAFRLLRSLRTALPRHSLLLADFDVLPPPSVRRATVDSDCAVGCYAPDTGGRDVGDWAAWLAERGGVSPAPRHRPTSPLVASKGEGGAGGGEGGGGDADSRATVDHATYMSARPGTADIFFPTDFSLLAHMVRAERERAASPSSSSSSPPPRPPPKVFASADFLRAYGQVERTRTLTGYNPMLEDYHNTRILVG